MMTSVSLDLKCLGISSAQLYTEPKREGLGLKERCGVVSLERIWEEEQA